MPREGRFEKNFSDPEGQKVTSAHPEKIKNETSRFHPVESTAKLNKEKNTEHQSPDTNEPRDVSNAKPEVKFGREWGVNREKNTEHQSSDTNEPRDVSHVKPGDKFGREWVEKQWQIASGNLKNELSQKVRDQPIEADARDRPDETATLNPSKENLTQQDRKLERNYRLLADHMLRAKL